MGEQEGKHAQPEIEQDYRFTSWEDVCGRVGGTNGDRSNHSALQAGSWLADRITVHPTGFQERVYDLRNCGPRHRFAVWDIQAGRARIVSNCTQSVARDILYHAMTTLRHCDIVMHCHDEIIVEADHRMSVDAVCQQMSLTPPWANGLPLRAEGFVCQYYQKG